MTVISETGRSPPPPPPPLSIFSFASPPFIKELILDGKPILAIVVPCYNEETTIPLFYDETLKILPAIKGIIQQGKPRARRRTGLRGIKPPPRIKTEQEIEFIFVDDGSKDHTLDILRELSTKDSRVHYISFSRNFGKEAAMLAGLQAARGEYTVVLDADGQDPPALIPQMLDVVRSGKADCAGTRRVSRRGEPPVRSFFARRFYALMQKIADIEIVDGARDFRLMNRKYLEAILALPERNRFSKGIFPWIGFKTTWFEYKNIERKSGSTKWSFWKLFLYSLDGIIAFSSKPLAIASVLGVLFVLSAFIFVILIVIRKFVMRLPDSGWSSLMCLILFCSGIQFFTISILGQYTAKTYTEVKQRPCYIVREAR